MRWTAKSDLFTSGRERLVRFQMALTVVGRQVEDQKINFLAAYDAFQ